jgi:peroxiredoxin Q/BCP
LCQSLRESGDNLREFDVAFFAASVDPPETNRRFAEKIGADYPMLSDPERRAATAYGVVNGSMPSATRWTFYVGRDGRILYVDKQVNPTSHGRDIVRRLAELGVARRPSQKR